MMMVVDSTIFLTDEEGFFFNWQYYSILNPNNFFFFFLYKSTIFHQSTGVGVMQVFILPHRQVGVLKTLIEAKFVRVFFRSFFVIKGLPHKGFYNVFVYFTTKQLVKFFNLLRIISAFTHFLLDLTSKIACLLFQS